MIIRTTGGYSLYRELLADLIEATRLTKAAIIIIVHDDVPGGKRPARQRVTAGAALERCWWRSCANDQIPGDQVASAALIKMRRLCGQPANGKRSAHKAVVCVSVTRPDETAFHDEIGNDRVLAVVLSKPAAAKCSRGIDAHDPVRECVDGSPAKAIG